MAAGNSISDCVHRIEGLLAGPLDRETMREIEQELKAMLFSANAPASSYLDGFLSSIAMLKRHDTATLENLRGRIRTTSRIICALTGSHDHATVKAMEKEAHAHLMVLKSYWPAIEFSERTRTLMERYKAE